MQKPSPMINQTSMAVHRIPEACPVCLPNPSIASVKMVGNMMELNSPTLKMLHIANCPFVSIEITTKVAAQKARIASVLPGFCFPKLNAKKFKPTSTRNVMVLLNPANEKDAKF